MISAIAASLAAAVEEGARARGDRPPESSGLPEGLCARLGEAVAAFERGGARAALEEAQRVRGEIEVRPPRAASARRPLCALPHARGGRRRAGAQRVGAEVQALFSDGGEAPSVERVVAAVAGLRKDYLASRGECLRDWSRGGRTAPVAGAGGGVVTANDHFLHKIRARRRKVEDDESDSD